MWPGAGPTQALALIMWPLRAIFRRKCVNITFLVFLLKNCGGGDYKLNASISNWMPWIGCLMSVQMPLSFVRDENIIFSLSYAFAVNIVLLVWMVACLWSFSFKVLRKILSLLRYCSPCGFPARKLSLPKVRAKTPTISLWTTPC